MFLNVYKNSNVASIKKHNKLMKKVQQYMVLFYALGLKTKNFIGICAAIMYD